MLALLALGASLALVTGASGTAVGSARATDDRIDPRVLEQIAAKGQTTFWVLLRQRADLSRAQGIQDWGARGRFVHERLTRTADASQSGIRSLLRKRGVPFEPFWIVNAIRVTAGESVVKELAAQREVERIIADGVYRIQKPQRGSSQQRVASIEWGIDRIRASLVWSTFGVRGENIVVANIDTGVQYNHPALVGKYRGNQGGSFDHNYNWYDPSRVCGNPSLVPCDNNSHGTHTMGTMVGDDGAGNQIGVAPGARWIAAKGCESNSCSFTALLSSGQWVLAPTDLNGQNPRTDLRPNIVNNSWGGGGGDPFYQDTVNAWVASGIFPAFSNGNSGPGCSTSGSPGDYVPSYSAGAFDSGNNIASFSSRGPSSFGGGELKPNIAAPGVAVRSSVPTNSYSSFSGTSMASPHVAGTVALIWSAAPALVGQIGSTRPLLDGTAIDTANLTCGGTAGDNNVWGEGRLDAYEAVNQAPRGPAGTLEGTVTGNGTPISGATVEVTGTSTTRTTYTNASGYYSMRLPVGSYSVTARAFGWSSQTASGVAVREGATTTENFALGQAPSHSVSGYVRDAVGAAIANATVTILDTPLAPATTDGTGHYSFLSVPDGTYQVRAEAGRCNNPETKPLVLSGGDATLDFLLPARSDTFGYSCSISGSGFISADNVLALSGDDSALAVGLPFSFSFYGTSYSTAYVSTNGLISFIGLNTSWSNSPIPSTGPPNGAVYGFWDDLYVDSQASVRTQTLGTSSDLRFVVEWRNLHFYGDTSRRVTFEVELYADGRILTQYTGIASDGREQGNSATGGIENASGSDALQYSYGEPAIADGLAVLYSTATGGGGSPTITTASLDDGTTGIAYSESLTATGGAPPYTWDLAPGSTPLPPGLSLSSSGGISGTPTTASVYSFTVRVTDSAAQSSTKVLSIRVGTPVEITPTSLPGGTAGAAYSPQTLAATGGTTPYGWSVDSGSLPPGLALDSSTGTISGTPTTADTYNFTVRVTDSATPARTHTQGLTIVIAPGLSIITSSPLSPCTFGISCQRTIGAVGGTSPYTWTLIGGSLPPGLTWSPAGPSVTTDGAPTKPGNYTFTFQVMSGALTATKTFSLKVNRK